MQNRIFRGINGGLLAGGLIWFVTEMMINGIVGPISGVPYALVFGLSFGTLLRFVHWNFNPNPFQGDCEIVDCHSWGRGSWFNYRFYDWSHRLEKS